MNRRAGLKPLVAHVAVAAACLAALPDGQGRRIRAAWISAR